MVEPAERQATYADLQAVPSHLVAEIIDGTLVTHPRSTPRHSVASSVLGMKLGGFQLGGDGPGGWVFMDEPELHLGHNVIVPDIAGWRRERLSVLPETAYLETAPDWVCEVISASTETYDRVSKRRIYAGAGVSHLWLLDPRSKVLEVFALAGDSWLLVGTFRDGDNVAAPPFDVMTFPLSALWPLDVEGEVSPNAQ
ncbi:Uma2 family endonuclease [Afifella sp. JA880]|uniref:Uma2 family endonuclease n=1 Tax=Afifella sp. JA880 TaxID=2975280 RepID=UPI0021BAE6DC|nr:Uma2 family endonuclease [Afifella sp. JA880]MCT8265980.1 Uma2 family endonuclease [Afifella sp. JA880]